jgi:hypothetical protein
MCIVSKIYTFKEESLTLISIFQVSDSVIYFNMTDK